MDLLQEGGWLAALILGVLGAKPFWDWMAARVKARRSPPAEERQASAAEVSADARLLEAGGQFMTALGESWQKHTDELRVEIRELNTKVDAQGVELRACEDHRAECEGRVLALEKQVALMVAATPTPAYLPGLAPMRGEGI